MEFLTAEEIAQQLRCSVWFVYQNRRIFGGIKIGKLVRFDKEIFESKIREVKDNDLLSAPREMALRLLEEQSSPKGKRISNEERSQGSRSRSSEKTKGDEFGIYKDLRQSSKRP
jgi:hypothetical protein